MVYSHGGGFTTGSGGAPYQDATGLAREWDTVVVATNHRLGLFGFLCLQELGGEEFATSGNQGMLDICDALHWVHSNIEAFGGDPGNVMIFGESGGGAKTSCLYAMPAAAPYFHKASIESGPGIRMMPLETAAETTRMVLSELGLGRSEWRKLLEVPAARLLECRLRSPSARTLARSRAAAAATASPATRGPAASVPSSTATSSPIILSIRRRPPSPKTSRSSPAITATKPFSFLCSRKTPACSSYQRTA
jgi:para-nitrobenzyl esterase